MFLRKILPQYYLRFETISVLKRRFFYPYFYEMKPFIFIIFLFCTVGAAAQNAFIRLSAPGEEPATVNSARQFITGATCKGCTIKLNGADLKVYPTGAFVGPVQLAYGDTSFLLEAQGPAGKKISRTVRFIYRKPLAPKAVESFTIESISVSPSGNLWVNAGDRLRIRMKALPGCRAKLPNGVRLKELPAKQAGIAGIYTLDYLVKESDNWLKGKFEIFLEDPEGNTIKGSGKHEIQLMDKDEPVFAQTIGDLAYLKQSLGEDRLGAPRLGYIDSAITLQVLGKTGDDYKVRLSRNISAYISTDQVKLLPEQTAPPQSLTGSWRVWTDTTYEYVSIGLEEKLPYRSFQQIDPARIVVDLYGATSNSNWIAQFKDVEEVKNVDYDVVQDGVMRITIWLKHQQHWGHRIYYNGKNLVVRIKKQPVSGGRLAGMRIGLDAGHGGSNLGARGITGIYEKDLALAIALKLKVQLEKEGAVVIASRAREMDFNNNDRMRFFREKDPDFLISIHLNSAGDPLRVRGTSTYYKHLGFRPLSLAIYKRMLELGLREFGNVGNFNFILNAPIEYPNALVECLFISNPEDEGLAMDENFQQQMAEKIVRGIKDWLEQLK